MIGERPPQGWCHPVGVLGAERIALTGIDSSHEVGQPHRPVAVTEGHERSAGAAASNAGFNHALNLDGPAVENKDLRLKGYWSSDGQHQSPIGTPDEKEAAPGASALHAAENGAVDSAITPETPT